jgi:hypothetical protein
MSCKELLCPVKNFYAPFYVFFRRNVLWVKITFNSKEDSDKELIIKFKEQNIDITKDISNMIVEADSIAIDKYLLQVLQSIETNNYY